MPAPKSPQKPSAPRNRAPGARPSEPPHWFQVTNFADQGYAEIKLRGYIGMASTARDYWTGELYDTGGAGTLQEFEKQLEALGAVKKIQLSIFSEGGDVFTGMAIHNLLIRHPAKKVCVIDGICASAATYPALACQEIRIPSNAWMMIHGTTGCVCGGPEEMRKYADMLESMNSTLVNLYAKRTGKGEQDIAGLLAAETWMNGQTAVDEGFADTVIEPLENLSARAGTLQPTNSALLRTAPAEVLALFDMSRVSNARLSPAEPSSMKLRTPLLNAATETPPAGGGAAPAAPAAAPVPGATPPPAAAPTNAAPPPAAPAVPPVAAPPADFASQITAAVNAAVKPLQDEIANLKQMAANGVTGAQLGGAPPTPTNAAPAPGKTASAPVDLASMNPLQLINLGRTAAKQAGAPAPAATA